MNGAPDELINFMCDDSGLFINNFLKLGFRNRLVLKMKGNRTGVIKMHSKSSGKSCSGITNIRTIFFGDAVFQDTFKQIYDVGSIEKSSGSGGVFRYNYVGCFEFPVA